MNLNPAAIISTSYGTGPYRITKMIGPCTCPTYVDTINCSNPPKTREHYHLVCRMAYDKADQNDYHISHIDASGRSVVEDTSLAMHESFLIFHPDLTRLEIGQSADLFEEATC